MSFGRARRPSVLGDIIDSPRIVISDDDAKPRTSKKKKTAVRRKSSVMRKKVRRSSTASLPATRMRARRRSSSVSSSLLKSTEASRARLQRRGSTSSTKKKAKRKGSVLKRRRAKSASSGKIPPPPPPLPLPDAENETATHLASPRSSPAMPGRIRVRTPPRVREAIKLTDFELAEVKAFNMLDLGVSMASETAETIVPTTTREVDLYSDQDSQLRPALADRAAERMQPGSASVWMRAGVPSMQHSRGRAQANPWWVRDPGRVKELAKASAKGWTAGERKALADRLELWKLWRRESRHDRTVPIRWVRRGGDRRISSEKRKAIASAVPPSTFLRPRWGLSII